MKESPVWGIFYLVVIFKYINSGMLKIASNRDMTSGSPLTVLINFTVPLLLGNLLQQTYSIVDAVIVGKFLGINSLAAVGAGTSVITLIFRYTIQGVGYTRLALFSGISEMLARTFVSSNVYNDCHNNKPVVLGYIGLDENS